MRGLPATARRDTAQFVVARMGRDGLEVYKQAGRGHPVEEPVPRNVMKEPAGTEFESARGRESGGAATRQHAVVAIAENNMVGDNLGMLVFRELPRG